MTFRDKVTTRRKLKTTVAAPHLSVRRGYAAGELIADKYQLIELLGEGGMGAVWRAHNNTLDIDVAVKLIRTEETEAQDGPQLAERLLQEARAAARLGHPAIARVFDFGSTDRGDPYIVMELLQGEDLGGALARRGRINATKAVSILMPIAHALAAAHGKGIVHRDLKPENIYLAVAEDGRTQPKLVDFGIAKVEKAKSNRLTQTGTMLGSPIYMSPEQARGDDVDHLADVWAFCVVLYEMVAGRPPFEGKNYNALLYSIIADDPAAITSFGGGDDELWALLHRGFQKDPDKRWPSIRHLGVELARWMIARGVHEDITGASLSAQWLRTLKVGSDSLSSLRPELADAELVPGIDMFIRRQQVTVPGTQSLALDGRHWGLPKELGKARVIGVAIAALLFGASVAVAMALSGETQKKSAAVDDSSSRPISEQGHRVPLEESQPDDSVEQTAHEPQAADESPSAALAVDRTPEEPSAEPPAPKPSRSRASPRRHIMRPSFKKGQLKDPFSH